MPLQLRILRALAILFFAISLMAAVLANVITIAPRTIKVVNKDGEIIGRGTIPADYSGATFWSSTFMVISGIQLWTVLAVVKYRSEDKNNS